MVNIQLDGLHANIYYQGDTIRVAMEMVTAISGVYQSIDSRNPEEGAAFKSAIQHMINDGSPVWEKMHEMTEVRIPVIKKSDTPTDQS